MIYSRLRLVSLFLERRKLTSGGERPNLKQQVAQAQPASPLASWRLCLIAFLPVNCRAKEKLLAASKMFTSNLPQINLYAETPPSSLVCSRYWARATFGSHHSTLHRIRMHGFDSHRGRKAISNWVPHFFFLRISSQLRNNFPVHQY